MTLRYSHLSPAHQLDAVQRLNVTADAAHSDTSTDTDDDREKVAALAGAKVPELAGERSGGAQNRTADLGIMRPSL